MRFAFATAKTLNRPVRYALVAGTFARGSSPRKALSSGALPPCLARIWRASEGDGSGGFPASPAPSIPDREMPNPIALLLGQPLLRRAVTHAANWIDLQWSVTIEQLREVAPSARGRLLDVGCGTKPYASLFAKYVDEYVGLEVERSFSATVASASAAPDVYYDGSRMPFADECFDTVLCIQVLEHTPDPARLLAEIARVVRRDGTVILSAPFSFRLHEEPHDYFRYTPHGLESLCERAGLEVTRRWTQGSLWSAFGHALNSFLAFRVASLGGTLQALGKLTHEGRTAVEPRLMALPFVVPGMVLVSGGARILDRLLSDPSMALGYQLTARKKSL